MDALCSLDEGHTPSTGKQKTTFDNPWVLRRRAWAAANPYLLAQRLLQETRGVPRAQRHFSRLDSRYVSKLGAVEDASNAVDVLVSHGM
jgi:hypothetical protein